MNNYSIYPSLLDSFYWAKINGTWGELLDKVNRVETEKSESALKGIRFESIINKTLDGEIVEQSEFDQKLIEKIAYKLCNNIGRQKFIQDIIYSKYGNVRLYGFIDYEYTDKFIDLKTCDRYKPGKYENYSQHKCYPLIGKKESLVYLVTDFKEVFIEPYQFTSDLKDKLMFEINEFIEWLEVNRGGNNGSENIHFVICIYQYKFILLFLNF